MGGYLPRPVPFLQPLFPDGRVLHVVVQLMIDEHVHAVVLVLPYTLNEVAGQCPVALASEDVDGWLFHGPSVRWIPACAGMTVGQFPDVWFRYCTC